MEEYQLIAKTFMGLEQVLAEELTELGADNVETGRRMVTFTGDKAMMYRANMQLRTAIRILKPISHFKAGSADEVYDNVKAIDWTDYLVADNTTERATAPATTFRTFAVDAVVFSDEFKHSKFVAYKVKDAIVDQLREKTGARPNVSIANPDLRLHIHIADDRCTLCLDSSGTSLHQRGYRQESTKAPLNEVLAAGLIKMTGWQGQTDFIDPMCGSGTLLIEAALIALNMAPGIFRKEYAFERWPDYDAELFDTIYNDDSRERPFEHKIYGYDIDIKAVNTARHNIKAAGLSQYIEVEQRDFKDFTQPQEPAIIVTNPPYGERITTPNLLGTYDMIGEKLKHQFKGNEAWIISGREELFDKIGLRPSIKIPVYNGSIECEFRRYQMFDGKLRDYRMAGSILKTDEERAAMSEKHRFKTQRGDFKKRLEEVENDESDIRSFGFKKYNFMADRFGRRYDDRHESRTDDRRGYRSNDNRGHGGQRRSYTDNGNGGKGATGVGSYRSDSDRGHHTGYGKQRPSGYPKRYGNNDRTGSRYGGQRRSYSSNGGGQWRSYDRDRDSGKKDNTNDEE